MNTTTTNVILCKVGRKLKGETVHFWRLRWTDSDGRQRYQRLSRCDQMLKREAQRLLREKITELGNHPERADRPDRIGLSDFAAFHNKALTPHARPATLAEYRAAIKHACAALGDVSLASVKWEHAEKIRDHLGGRRPATIRKTLATLRAMFQRAADRGMIHANPFARIPLGPPIAKEKRIFTRPETDAIISQADELWAALVTLAVTTGLRKTELLHLRWSDIDNKAKTVRVEEHHEGTESGCPIFAWKPKTAKSTRTVPLMPDALAALARLQLRSDSPYCFVDAARLKHLATRVRRGKGSHDLLNNFTREFNTIQTWASIYKLGTFHDLRKTFGTRAATAGVPVHELCKWLGHASITTTADYYLGIDDTAADRLRAALSA